MDVKERQPRYQSYMLRMWEERSESHQHCAVWRFQVEDPHTGRRHGFVDLAALLAYLEAVVARDNEAGAGRL